MPRKKELKENIEDTEKVVKKTPKKTTETKKTQKNLTTKKTTPRIAKVEQKSDEKAKKSTSKDSAKKKKTTVTPKTTSKAKKDNVDKTEKKTTRKKVTKTENEVDVEKTKETVIKRKVEKLDNLEKKENQVKDKVNEASVIEKIKSFLSKIIAMQEENLEKANAKEKKISSRKIKKSTPDYLLEYYDLPYRYNETVVKILAQTPKRLFVYWDISDKDKQKYIKTFGEDFFYKTYPVLLLYNEDKKYVQEIPINDFANSWYIDIQDPKNKYTIQLGRKFIGDPQILNMSAFEEEQIILKTDYLPFAESNKLEVPNNHVLLEFLPRFVKFRNVKTNQETFKDLRSFKDVFGTTYNVNQFYETQYKEELSEEGMFDMANPSSSHSSSFFK